MYALSKIAVSMGILSLLVAGCTTEPKTQDERAELHNDVQQTMNRLYSEDPSLPDFMHKADGYVVFPTVGKGAVGVGGAYGHGEVYENGVFQGYADLSQGTIGLQLGGQSYTEFIVFETADALKKFESGQFAFDANASATALKSGAAASAKYTDGVAVFVEVQGGLMFEASIGGQSFTYQPK